MRTDTYGGGALWGTDILTMVEKNRDLEEKVSYYALLL